MLNSFFIQQSGLSGWHQIGTGNHIPWYNTGNSGQFFLAESGDFLGLKTNRPESTFHIVQEGGDGAVLTLQSTGELQNYLSGGFNSYISFVDLSGIGGIIGFNESGTANLNIENRTTGDINLSANPILEKQFTLTRSGDVGIYHTLPQAKIHVVQSGAGVSGLNDNLAILQKTGIDSTDAPEFIVKNDGKIGINIYNPRHTLHVSEDKTTTALRGAGIKSGVGTVFSDSYLFGYETNYLSGKALNTIEIDYNGKSFRRISLTGTSEDVYITTVNGAEREDELKAVTILLEAPSGERSLSFFPGMRWLGYPPSGILSGDMGIISFNSFGPDPENTVAVGRQEGDTLVGPPGSPGKGTEGEAGEEFRNKIIGGMFDKNPWQRGTYFDSPTSGQYTADRFVYLKTGEAEFDISKDFSYPPPWSGYYFGQTEQSYPSDSSMKIQCVKTAIGMMTEDTFEPLNTGYYEKFNMIEQRVEGYHTRDLLPHNFSLTFWSYVSGVSGKFPVSIRNKNNDISYVAKYDMCHTGVWSFHSINVPAVTGSILNSSFNLDDDVGLRVGWTFGSSTGLNVRDENLNQWISGYYLGWTGDDSVANMVDMSGCCLKIAGPELKYGWRQGRELSRLRSQQQELELCKRYYERLDFPDAYSIGVGQCIVSSSSAGGSQRSAGLPSTANWQPAGMPMSGECFTGVMDGRISGPSKGMWSTGYDIPGYGRVDYLEFQQFIPVPTEKFPAGTTDPHWTDVSVLLQSAGAASSTDFTATDKSTNSHGITTSDGTHHSGSWDVPAKWGDTSIAFTAELGDGVGCNDHPPTGPCCTGQGDYLHIATDTSMQIAPSANGWDEWTLEAWFYIFAHRTGGSIAGSCGDAYSNGGGGLFGTQLSCYYQPAAALNYNLWFNDQVGNVGQLATGTDYPGRSHGVWGAAPYGITGYDLNWSPIMSSMTGGIGWNILFSQYGNVLWDHNQGMCSVASILTPQNTIKPGQWYYITLIKHKECALPECFTVFPFNYDGGCNIFVSMYINGKLMGWTVDNNDYRNGIQDLWLGVNYGNFHGGFLYGAMDDVRITKGVARYIASFSSPSYSSPTSVITNPNFPVTNSQLTSLIQTTDEFAGVKLDYQEKRVVPSISGSGSLAATAQTFEASEVWITGYEGTTKNQTSISGSILGGVFVGGHATVLKASGDGGSFFIDAEL